MSDHSPDGARTRTADLRPEEAAFAMSAAFRLVGYDKGSDRTLVEHEVPHRHAVAARNIAGLRDADETGLERRALSRSQAEFMGRMLHQPLDPRRFDYFLEPAPPLGPTKRSVKRPADGQGPRQPRQ